MWSSVTKIEKIEKSPVLPDGHYHGIWSGYEVKVKIDGNDYVLTTNSGVRGLNIPCWVDIDNLSITVREA